MERWKILRRAVIAASERSQGGAERTTRASVRSFTSFELFNITGVEGEELSSCVSSQAGAAESVWKRYSYEIGTATAYAAFSDKDTRRITGGEDRQPSGKKSDKVSAIISHLSPKTSLEAMMGFNNTGNVCVWPSEEVLTHYCLERMEQFRGKSVCELGGGMTCLAGLMLGQTGLPTRVVLTDGNTSSVDNVRRIIDANREGLGGVQVSAEVLVWDEAFLRSEQSVYDFVICADCLFFVDLHQYLCRVIHKLLAPGGTAILFNPARSGTLEQFVKVAERLFATKRCERYSELVWDKHCVALATDRYKSDLHYPILLTVANQ